MRALRCVTLLRVHCVICCVPWCVLAATFCVRESRFMFACLRTHLLDQVVGIDGIKERVAERIDLLGGLPPRTQPVR